MAVCLRKLARASHQAYPTQARTLWVTQQPSQLVLLISQVQAQLGSMGCGLQCLCAWPGPCDLLRSGCQQEPVHVTRQRISLCY